MALRSILWATNKHRELSASHPPAQHAHAVALPWKARLERGTTLCGCLLIAHCAKAAAAGSHSAAIPMPASPPHPPHPPPHAAPNKSPQQQGAHQARPGTRSPDSAPPAAAHGSGPSRGGAGCRAPAGRTGPSRGAAAARRTAPPGPGRTARSTPAPRVGLHELPSGCTEVSPLLLVGRGDSCCTFHAGPGPVAGSQQQPLQPASYSPSAPPADLSCAMRTNPQHSLCRPPAPPAKLRSSSSHAARPPSEGGRRRSGKLSLDIRIGNSSRLACSIAFCGRAKGQAERTRDRSAGSLRAQRKAPPLSQAPEAQAAQPPPSVPQPGTHAMYARKARPHAVNQQNHKSAPCSLPSTPLPAPAAAHPCQNQCNAQGAAATPAPPQMQHYPPRTLRSSGSPAPPHAAEGAAGMARGGSLGASPSFPRTSPATAASPLSPQPALFLQARSRAQLNKAANAAPETGARAAAHLFIQPPACRTLPGSSLGHQIDARIVAIVLLPAAASQFCGGVSSWGMRAGGSSGCTVAQQCAGEQPAAAAHSLLAGQVHGLGCGDLPQRDHAPGPAARRQARVGAEGGRRGVWGRMWVGECGAECGSPSQPHAGQQHAAGRTWAGLPTSCLLLLPAQRCSAPSQRPCSRRGGGQQQVGPPEHKAAQSAPGSDPVAW